MYKNVNTLQFSVVQNHTLTQLKCWMFSPITSEFNFRVQTSTVVSRHQQIFTDYNQIWWKHISSLKGNIQLHWELLVLKLENSPSQLNWCQNELWHLFRGRLRSCEHSARDGRTDIILDRHTDGQTTVYRVAPKSKLQCFLHICAKYWPIFSRPY